MAFHLHVRILFLVNLLGQSRHLEIDWNSLCEDKELIDRGITNTEARLSSISSGLEGGEIIALFTGSWTEQM